MKDSKAKKIVFIRANTYNSEPRLIKISEGIKNFEQHFVLWDRDDRGTSEGKNAVYFRRKSDFGNVKTLVSNIPAWSRFCWRELKKINPDIIHACDIEGVAAAYLYAKIFRKKLVYDIWDETSGKIVDQKSPLKKVANSLDRFYINRSDLFLLPDECRTEQIGIKKHLDRMVLVPNSTTITPGKISEINLSKKAQINIAYVGVMSRKIRGLEFIIEAAKKFNRFQFTVAGYGPDDKYFEQALRGIKNLTFLGRVDHAKAIEINNQADIIITLLDPNYENYKYATSTKAFEAFELLKPIITSEGTATARLINETGWGIAIKYNQKALENALDNIQNGIITFKLETNNAMKYSWDKVAAKLNAKYSELVGLG